MAREATTYYTVRKIVNDAFTENEINEWLSNPVDTHKIFDVIHKAAEMVKQNHTYQFSCYDSDDLYQLCWGWAYDVLLPKTDPKTGIKKAKYNYLTSLYGYLDTIFKNKIFKLRRDKQWRNDIADQKACKQCKERDRCPRKIYLADKDKEYTCHVIIKSIKRNEAKHALSVQMDDDITERRDEAANAEREVIASDIYKILHENLPEKERKILEKLVAGEKISNKKSIEWMRRRCHKIIGSKVHDEEEHKKFKQTLQRISWRERRRKFRWTKRKMKLKNMQEQKRVEEKERQAN